MITLPTTRPAIYPSKQLGSYVFLLAGCKLLKAIGIFLTYDVTKVIHIVHYLFLVKLISGAFFLVIQKPISSGGKLSKSNCFRIIRHSIVGCLLDMMWLFGLSFCGPFRYILLYEHSDIIVIAAASALYAGSAGPSKTRGAVFFLLGVFSLLFFDHDQDASTIEHPEGRHTNFVTHKLFQLIEWFGLSDHKGGALLLLLALCLQTGYSTLSRGLAAAIGGSKRLHGLSTALSALILMPFSFILYVTSEASSSVSFLHLLFVLTFTALSVFLVDVYVSSLCAAKLSHPLAARYSSLLLAGCGLLLSALWNHPSTTATTTLHKVISAVSEEHRLSGGVLASTACIVYAVLLLTTQSKSSGQGQFVGYSSGGTPLYNLIAGDHRVINKVSQSFLLHSKDFIRQILHDDASRRIFYFLCINLGFTFVELLYGVWTNSLGLISDGFHMLFDSSALVMGLCAAVMSKWKPNRLFSFGYHRVEVLSGFINALFLIVISASIFTSSLGRLFDPPTINTERLLTVSIAGFLVNMIGIFALGHAHSHGGGGSQGHSHGGGGGSHGHSHGGGTNHGHSHSSGSTGHGHSHSGGATGHGHSHTAPCSDNGHSHSSHGKDEGDNTNMKGVYLHVLADTLGSIGVIFSSFLVQQYGWNLADPICSLFISLLIFHSVLPLVQETLAILTLKAPHPWTFDSKALLTQVLAIEGVERVKNPYIWQHTSNILCVSIRVNMKPGHNEQNVLSQITQSLKSHGIDHLTVQIETEEFDLHMSGMGNKVSTDTEFRETDIQPSFSVHTV